MRSHRIAAVRGHRTMLAAVVVALSLATAPSASAQNPSNPPPPPGANDRCKPLQDPTPVVVVHGTFANRYVNFIRIRPT